MAAETSTDPSVGMWATVKLLRFCGVFFLVCVFCLFVCWFVVLVFCFGFLLLFFVVVFNYYYYFSTVDELLSCVLNSFLLLEGPGVFQRFIQL